MMRLIKRAASTIGFIAAIIAIILIWSHVNVHEIRSEAKLKAYTFEELHGYADLIVEAEFARKSSTNLIKDLNGIPYDWRTYSDLVINKVHFSNRSNIKAGDIVNIVEFYADWRDLRGSFRIVTGHYEPLVKNEKYLLFLAQEEGKDYYEIIGLHQGKYTIGQEASAMQSEDRHYAALAEQVFTKYR